MQSCNFFAFTYQYESLCLCGTLSAQWSVKALRKCMKNDSLVGMQQSSELSHESEHCTTKGVKVGEPPAELFDVEMNAD